MTPDTRPDTSPADRPTAAAPATARRRYRCVDVFTATLMRGNPLAVVVDAEGLDDATMAAFARWTQLSETTFLLPPDDPAADYRVRIWTPFGELPFAGHPTLGSCHVWLATGGRPRTPGLVVQQCGVGRVTVRQDADGRLAFAAPPLRRSGPLDADLRVQLEAALRLAPGAVLDDQWVDNGSGFCALRLVSADAVRAVRPDWPALAGLRVGLVGAAPADAETRFEVRGLIGAQGGALAFEDPVTGSLQAGLAQWLIGVGAAPARYVAAQGHCAGRAGRVHVAAEGGRLWIGGDVVDGIAGTVQL